MPTDQEEVVSAVGFFEDDGDGGGVGDAAVVLQAEVGEVGGGPVWVVGAVGADGAGGGDAYAAAAEEFDGEFASGQEEVTGGTV